MAAAPRRAPLLLALLLLATTLLASAEVGSPGRPPPNKCALQSLAGACNGCVCCCTPQGERPRLFPTDACTCAPPALDAAEASARLTALVAGGGGLVLVCLLSLCWFSGWCCCASPYERTRHADEEGWGGV